MVPPAGPGLSYFMSKGLKPEEPKSSTSPPLKTTDGHLKYFIETYGCQMNVSDSEIVRAILLENGHSPAESVDVADLILVNTWSVHRGV